MIDIKEYILLEQKDRQAHLKLDEPCLERGGQSMYLKGLLAHIHDTTIPSGKKIHVCHACHNAKCSNPNHLYWGTPSENRLDAIANGGFVNPWEASVAKYGLEEARKRQGKGNKAAGGRGNKGKPKSAEHRRKIAESVTRKHAERMKKNK